MVLPGNFLKLSLGLNPPQQVGSDDNGALFRADNAGLYSRDTQGIPSYATNINRLHYTVKRARSIIEGRDASVPVPESELAGILTKIEDLESQVKALFRQRGATAPTWPVAGPAPASQATSDKAYGPAGGAGDQDCDAENLIFDMGARAVVDEDGQVTGHPLFRRNANCPMRSAVHGKHASNTGGPRDSSEGSARGGGVAAAAAAAAAAANNQDAAVLDISVSRARAGFPQVVPATVETVEVKTLPINGEFVASTITRTTTLLSTVTVVPDYYKATDFAAAKEASSHHSDHAMKKPKQSHSEHEHVHKHKAKISPPHVPAAPSSSSFSQFSNDTSRFSNSTTVGHIPHVADGQKPANATVQKSFNHTSVEKTESSPPEQVDKPPVQQSQKAANTTAPQDSVGVARSKPAKANTTADKAASTPSTPSSQVANLAETGGSGEKAEKVPDAKADDESVDGTSHQETNSATDTSHAKDPKEKIRVITVVPIPAQPASAPPAVATAAVAPGIVAEKAGSRANATLSRAQDGFKTVRVPGSK